MHAMPKRDAYIEHLANVPLFSECNNRDLRLIARSTEEIQVPAGKELVTQGETGREFFVIVEGSAIVVRDGEQITTLGPGDFFGELALLDRGPRSATVIAETPMQLLVLAQREFSGLLDEVPSLAHKLLKGMAKRVREADAAGLH
jgi:CRP-like cAMP-binding protein